MKNKRFLKFIFVFFIIVGFSCSVNAWTLGGWTRPNRSRIPEFKSQAELGEKCGCVLKGGVWEEIENGAGRCCDEPAWFCTLYAAPECTPDPSCCQNEAFANAHPKECCIVSGGEWVD